MRGLRRVEGLLVFKRGVGGRRGWSSFSRGGMVGEEGAMWFKTAVFILKRGVRRLRWTNGLLKHS
jgi:hypothetical protein